MGSSSRYFYRRRNASVSMQSAGRGQRSEPGSIAQYSLSGRSTWEAVKGHISTYIPRYVRAEYWKNRGSENQL